VLVLVLLLVLVVLLLLLLHCTAALLLRGSADHSVHTAEPKQSLLTNENAEK